MARILLVTAPYSGTHFTANLLHLLNVDFAFCHAYGTYINDPRCIPTWISGAKLVTSYRNPWDTLISEFNRGVQDFDRQLRRINRQIVLAKAHSAFEIYADKKPPDTDLFIEELAAYCEVNVTNPARVQANQWPKMGGVAYSPLLIPKNISDSAKVETLCQTLQYPATRTWPGYIQKPMTGPTKADLASVLDPYRAIRKLRILEIPTI